VILLSRLPEQLLGSSEIAHCPVPLHVQERQCGFCFQITAFSSLGEPIRRFLLIRWDTFSIGTQLTELDLRSGNTSGRRIPEPFHSLR
jgi:hypothetical protein